MSVNADEARVQRFVCCVAWDRRLYVFLDDDEGDASSLSHYLYRMPRVRARKATLPLLPLEAPLC